MFEVERIAAGADVFDPRVLTFPAGWQNESHRHAHETLMLVLSSRAVWVGANSLGGNCPGVAAWRIARTGANGSF